MSTEEKMDENVQYGILFVDDEDAILKSLARLFRKEGYRIMTAIGGVKGLELLENDGENVAVIVSDQKMPGMNGAQFLEKAKAICPDALRILLTGYSDMEAIVSAVNKGEIHRYMTKPWNDNDLIIQVRKAVEQYALIEENKRLMQTIKRQNKQLYDFGKNMEKRIEERSREIMEKSKTLEYLNKELEIGFYNTIRAFASLIEMAHPNMSGHGKRVSDLSVGIAQKMGLGDEETKTIEIAAILHDIGTLAYSQELMEKYSRERCSPEEMAQYKMHPVEGQSILSFVNRLDTVGLLIRHHHERYDGKGYPDSLFENEIPLGSRIIAVADKYDRLSSMSIAKKTTYIDNFLRDRNITRDMLSDEELIQQSALHYVKQNSFIRFDPEVVKLLMVVLRDKGINLAREKKVMFDELEAGMCLTRSLYTNNGRFVLPYKTELTKELLMKIKIILENSEISNAFYIVSK